MKSRTKSVMTVFLAAMMVFGGAPLASLAGLTGWFGSLSVTSSALTDDWDGSTASGFASGTGTENDPYIIETAEQLAYLSASVNNSESSYSGCYIRLANNIVLNSSDVFACDEQGRVTGKAEGKTARQWEAVGGFKPITITSEAEFNTAVSTHGLLWYIYDSYVPSYSSINKFDLSCTQYYYEEAFEGVFDGNGQTVSGIYISDENVCQGLFGKTQNATVKNLNVIGSYIEGRSDVGGITGISCNSTVSNCFNTAAVNGTAYVGGIAGRNIAGQIDNCCNSGSVLGTRFAGGITGENQGNSSVRSFIIDCRNRGTVSGEHSLGGVTGENKIGTITGSINSGYVNSNNGNIVFDAGGIAGVNKSGIIENCRNTGRIDGMSSVGGVAGSNDDSIISRCCNTGNISGSTAGGICGDYFSYIAGSVTNCYNTGSITGGTAGGIIGSSMTFNFDSSITRNYNVGSVPGTRDVGGIVGTNDYFGSGVIITEFPCTVGIYNCYFLTGSANGAVNGGGSSGRLNKLTDAEMKTESSFYEWDFTNVWTMDGNTEYPYPELRGMAYGTAQAEAVTVSQNELNLVIGNTRQLSAEAANSGVVWLSSNDEVATVSDTGVVTAVSEGTAVITVTALDGGFTDTCSVTVAPLALTTIEVKTLPSKTDYIIGDTLDTTGLTLTATFNDDSKQTISTGFECSPTVFTAAGTQTVTAAWGGKSCTFDVTVGKIDAIGFDVTAIPDSTYTGIAITPAITVNFNGATLTQNTDYAVIYSDNINVGTATVTITGIGNYTGTTQVTFTIISADIAVTGITLSSKALSLQYKGTSKLTVTFNPTDATNKKVTWTSSNKDVATVDTKGNVTAVGSGKAVITVTTKDGGYSACCTVTVKLDFWQMVIKILLFGWLRY